MEALRLLVYRQRRRLARRISVVALGVALPLLKRDFVITPLLVGFIGSALVLGAVAGAALGGVAADRVGRKRVFIADMTIIGIAGLIGAAAPNPNLTNDLDRDSVFY